MARFLLLVLASLASACATQNVLAADAARAAQAGKPLIVEMTAEWCAPCRTFETEVLADAQVQAALNDVTFIRVDWDESKGRRARTRYHLRSVPTFLVIGPGTDVLLGHVGRLTRDEFIELIRWSLDERASRPAAR